MTQRPTFVRTEPAQIPPHKALPGAERAVRTAFLAIATTALVGIAHADVDVSDAKTHDKLGDIAKSIGDGDLNKTSSNLLKEIQTGVKSLRFETTLPSAGNSNQLKKISDPSAYVKQACPSNQGGGVVGSALGAVAGAGGGSPNVTTPAPLSAGKQKICQELIQLRVQAFNDSVEMTNRFEQYSKQLAKIDENRNSTKTQGDLWANTNESLRTTAKLQAEMGFWRTRLAAYESAIKFHEGQQNALSQTAIRGSGGSLPSVGQLIQTGALAAALAIK